MTPRRSCFRGSVVGGGHLQETRWRLPASAFLLPNDGVSPRGSATNTHRVPVVTRHFRAHPGVIRQPTRPPRTSVSLSSLRKADDD